MAWTELTATGIIRLRDSWREEGKRFKEIIISDLGTDQDFADSTCSKYKEAKRLGYVWNPKSDHVLADIEYFLEAKKLGLDPTEPAQGAKASMMTWLKASELDSSTHEKYRKTVEAYFDYSKIKTLHDMTVESVIDWRDAMTAGKITYTRGGKDEKGREKRYPYDPITISIKVKDLRIFCNYCVFRGWMTNEPANKTKPLNPFAQIKVAEPKDGAKRYLSRSEAARLLWACRLERFKAGGNKPIPELIRKAIIDFALKSPELGKRKVKRLLTKKGMDVGTGTIDWVWRRNNLLSERLRRRAAKGSFVPAQSYIDNPKANSRLRRRLHFELYTGLRDGEARRVRCEDIISHDVIDRDSSRPTRVYGLNVLKPSKGGATKVRVVWFPTNAARIHGIAKKFGRTGPLLEPLSKSALSKARRLAVKRAGLGRVRSHDMRHSFARNFLLSRTGTIKHLQEALGHSRLATTGIYSNFANTDLAESAKIYRVK